MLYRNRHDDPVTAILELYYALGFDDDDILARERERWGDTPDDPRELIKNRYVEAHKPGFDVNATPTLDSQSFWEAAPTIARELFPTRFGVDWKDHAYQVIRNASLGLRRFDLEAAVTFPARESVDNTWPTLDTEHPEVLELVVRTASSGDLAVQVPFRLPPCSSVRNAVRNHFAAAGVLDHVLQSRYGLEIVSLRNADDSSQFAVVESDRLDAVNPKHYRGLLERGLLSVALLSYAPENAIDHEREFGIPEPPETLKLELLPAAQGAIATGVGTHNGRANAPPAPTTDWSELIDTVSYATEWEQAYRPTLQYLSEHLTDQHGEQCPPIDGAIGYWYPFLYRLVRYETAIAQN